VTHAPPSAAPDASGSGLERRLVVLPLGGSDGVVASRVLAAAAVEVKLCASTEELCAEAEIGAAAVMLAEEALTDAGARRLMALLDRQPAWSDIPVIVLTARSREATAHWRLIADLPSIRNATLLERPMRTETLVQAVQVALRARERQYQLRAYLGERERLLAQRETLLREVQHRVKNNLQIIQSLVRMSAARAPPEATSLFTDIVNRIWAIGQLHTRIYAADDLAEIDLAAYLGDIADQAATGFGALRGRTRVVKRLEPVSVGVDTAIPIGLIATELLTNSFKYAFPDGRAGEIRIALAAYGGVVELTVADDGVGLPAVPGGTSSGLRLVQALAGQIGGELEPSDGPGARFTLCFPLQQRLREPG
jgi:two-component sensor histidine kinase